MPNFHTIQLWTGIVAGLCVPLLPIWLLGVPGVDGHYARGWKMGLVVVFCYPWAWFFNWLVYFVAKGRVAASELPQWQNTSGWIYLVLFVAAVLRVIQAFRVMKG